MMEPDTILGEFAARFYSQILPNGGCSSHHFCQLKGRQFSCACVHGWEYGLVSVKVCMRSFEDNFACQFLPSALPTIEPICCLQLRMADEMAHELGGTLLSLLHLCRRAGLYVQLYVGSEDLNFDSHIWTINALFMEPALQAS